MADETPEAEEAVPTSSKNGNQVSESRQNVSVDNDRHRENDQRSYSGSTTSHSAYSKSQVEVAEIGPESVKPIIGKLSRQDRKKKRREDKRFTGRVEKKRRSLTRRQARKPSKRRPKPKERNTEEQKPRAPTPSTIFSGYSSGSSTPDCKYCGHRCCRRRFEYYKHRSRQRYRKNRKMQAKRRTVRMPRNYTIEKKCLSERIQVGSRCNMLSPLFLNYNAANLEEPQSEEATFCEITPEMIFDSLKSLAMWKEGMEMEPIINFMKRCYPVNPDDTQLAEELTEKLWVASVVGIVEHMPNDHWRLNSALLRDRNLPKTVVTTFWLVYADTMKPIASRKKTVADAERNDNSSSTRNISPSNNKFFTDDSYL